ncbi:rhomboid family intramembrane serine protease [Niabella hibiscisoli]|uniref:rhomboid family intramembrane serine protease n=1 Tax=Niabella hibiscisoli TaxID=1825928 RepID=UPI0021D44143|nr:rhomboid family intramembrane serine protease [Niabella hibiscisoli]
MAISDRNYDSRLSFGTKVNPLVVLIGIAMIIFVVLTFFRGLTILKLPENGDVTGVFNKNVLCWFALSGDTALALGKPWTVLTYSFVHTNIWQLFASMIWLWSFGYILVDLTGFKKIVPVFYTEQLPRCRFPAGKEFFTRFVDRYPVFFRRRTSYFSGLCCCYNNQPQL